MEDLNVGKPPGELVRVRQGQKDQCVCVCMWLCGCIFMPAWCVRRSVSVSRMSGCVTVVWKLLPVNVCIWVCACVCLIFCLSFHIYIMCVKNTQAPPTPHLPVCMAELCQPTGGSIFIHPPRQPWLRVVSPQRRLLLQETHSKAAELVVIYRNNSASCLLTGKCFLSAVESWKWITNSRITDLKKWGSGCSWYNCSNYSGGLAAVERCCPHKGRRACFN